MLILNFTCPLRCLRVPPVEYHWSREYRLSNASSVLQLAKNSPLPMESKILFPCSQEPILSHLNSFHTIISYLRYILRVYFHLRLGLPSGLLPSRYPTKILWAFLFSTVFATCPARLILLAFKTLLIFGQNLLTKWLKFYSNALAISESLGNSRMKTVGKSWPCLRFGPS
jgi:hypothetical protein